MDITKNTTTETTITPDSEKSRALLTGHISPHDQFHDAPKTPSYNEGNTIQSSARSTLSATQRASSVSPVKDSCVNAVGSTYGSVNAINGDYFDAKLEEIPVKMSPPDWVDVKSDGKVGGWQANRDRSPRAKQPFAVIVELKDGTAVDL